VNKRSSKKKILYGCAYDLPGAPTLVAVVGVENNAAMLRYFEIPYTYIHMPCKRYGTRVRTNSYPDGT
jgi:hypothetical protein